MSGKETTMNMVLKNRYSHREHYEALNLDQGLELMCSNEILGKQSCVESENRC